MNPRGRFAKTALGFPPSLPNHRSCAPPVILSEAKDDTPE